VDIRAYDKLCQQDKDAIWMWINISDSINRIDNIFQMYLYSLSFFQNNLIADERGYMLRDNNVTGGFEVGVVVNAHAMMLLNNFKLLVDKIQSFFNKYIGKDVYKQYVSIVYDANFHYRFFYNLRNVASHDRPVVSVSEGKYLHFNLSQLREHIDRKKKDLHEEMLMYGKKIMDSYGTTANWSLLIALGGLHQGILAVYKSFLSEIAPVANESYKKTFAIRSRNQSIISQEDGFIYVRSHDDTLHVLPTAPLSYATDWLERLNALIDTEEIRLSDFLNSIKIVK
jgi:hypothetical protein